MDNKFKEDNYFTIQGFMINDLKLKGNELLIYAIIYGITQDGETEFYGSRSYLASACNTSLPTVDKALNSLVENDLLIKITETKNGVIFNKYKANKETLGGIKKLYRGYKETLQGYKETLHNNNIYNKEDNIKENIKRNEQFEEFYQEYPKKVGKKNAEKSFNKIKLTDELYELIITKLKEQKEAWKHNNTSKQYIPNPSTWLNQERWNDDIFIEETEKEKRDRLIEEQYKKLEKEGKIYDS